MRFIGIDLHYDSFVAAILDEKNVIKTVKVYLEDRKNFKQFVEELHKEDYMAIEASTNTFWFYKNIINKVKECYVLNTSRFSIIYRSNKKTDKIDAKKIAKKLRYKVMCGGDEDEFPTVYVPAEEVQELRTLFTTYETLAKQKTTIKNRIFSLFVQQGYKLKSSLLFRKSIRDAVLNIDIPEVTRIQLSVLYDVMDSLEKQKERIKQEILKRGSYFAKQIDKLVSIKGVSVFTAIAIMTDIADINRFANAKKLCSYLRSAPKIDSSNNTERIGSVNKQSRKLAIKMLLQGLHHIYKSSKYLYNFYNRKKRGKKAGKVRIAIARKIFVGIYHMLKGDRYFYWIDNKGYRRKIKEYKTFLTKSA